MKLISLVVVALALPMGAAAYPVSGLEGAPVASARYAGDTPIRLAENEGRGEGGEAGEGRERGEGGFFSFLRRILSDDDDGGRPLSQNPRAAGKVPPPDNGLITKGSKPVVIGN